MVRLIMAIRLSKLPGLYYMYLIVMAWQRPNILFLSPEPCILLMARGDINRSWG